MCRGLQYMPTEERQVSVYTCMHAGRQAARQADIHAHRYLSKQTPPDIVMQNVVTPGSVVASVVTTLIRGCSLPLVSSRQALIDRGPRYRASMRRTGI